MNPDADQHDDQASASDQQTPLASRDVVTPAIQSKRPPFAVVALLVLTSPFVFDAPIIAALKAVGESTVSPVLIGMLTAKFGLLVMWLGWGGSRAVLRMPVLALSCFFTAWLTPGTPTDKFEEFSVLFLVLIGCGSAVATAAIAACTMDLARGTFEQRSNACRAAISVFDLRYARLDNHDCGFSGTPSLRGTSTIY